MRQIKCIPRWRLVAATHVIPYNSSARLCVFSFVVKQETAQVHCYNGMDMTMNYLCFCVERKSIAALPELRFSDTRCAFESISFSTCACVGFPHINCSVFLDHDLTLLVIGFLCLSPLKCNLLLLTMK